MRRKKPRYGQMLVRSLGGFIVCYMLNGMLPFVTIAPEWTWLGVSGQDHLFWWSWMAYIGMFGEAFFAVIGATGLFMSVADPHVN